MAFNPKLPSVKRILQEARELDLEPSDQFRAAPLEGNLFEWHFTVRGPEDTPFAGGRYHGRLLMPAEYPFKPPTIMMLTPNGRFEVRKRICLSISDFHPEQWQPAWGVRTIMTALIAFFPSPADGAIGGLDYTAAERSRLAAHSLAWRCEGCGECMHKSFGSSAANPRIAAMAAAPAAAATGDGQAAADGGAVEKPETRPAEHDLAVARDEPGEAAVAVAAAAEPTAPISAPPAAPQPPAAQQPRAVATGAPSSATAGAGTAAASNVSPIDGFLHNLALGLVAAIVALVLKKLLKL